MGVACGSTLPTEINSTSNVINMLFKTDSSNTKEGWSVSWSAVTPGVSTMPVKLSLFKFFLFLILIAHLTD